MMSDSMKGRNVPNKFYTKDECVAMREKREIPADIAAYLDRQNSDEMQLADVGNDFTLNDEVGDRLATEHRDDDCCRSLCSRKL